MPCVEACHRLLRHESIDSLNAHPNPNAVRHGRPVPLEPLGSQFWFIRLGDEGKITYENLPAEQCAPPAVNGRSRRRRIYLTMTGL